jgi:hypothetical protein
MILCCTSACEHTRQQQGCVQCCEALHCQHAWPEKHYVEAARALMRRTLLHIMAVMDSVLACKPVHSNVMPTAMWAYLRLSANSTRAGCADTNVHALRQYNCMQACDACTRMRPHKQLHLTHMCHNNDSTVSTVL